MHPPTPRPLTLLLNVAHALDQSQRRRARGEYKRHFPTGQEKPFLPCPSIRALGNTHCDRGCNADFRKRVEGHLQLPRAAVDQQPLR